MRKRCKRSQTTDIIAIVFISIVLLLSIVIYRSIQVPSVKDSAAKVADTIASTQVAFGTESFLLGRDKGASISTLIGTYLCYKNNTINFSESPNMIYNFQSTITKRLDYIFGKNKWAILLYTSNFAGSSNACFYFDKTGSMDSILTKVNDIATEIDPTSKINTIYSYTSCKNDRTVCTSGTASCLGIFQPQEDWIGQAIDVAEHPEQKCPKWKPNEKKILFISSDELPGTCTKNFGSSYISDKKIGEEIVNHCTQTAVNILNKAGITVYFIWPDDGFQQCSNSEYYYLLKGARNLSKGTGGKLINLSDNIDSLKQTFSKYMGSEKSEFYIINSHEIKNVSSLKNILSAFTSKDYKSVDFIDNMPCTPNGIIFGTLFYKQK